MIGLNLLLPISLLGQSMHIPLNIILQSEFVNLVTLVYSNSTTESATAASEVMINAHQHWKTINIDRAFNKTRYYTKTFRDRSASAQYRDLVILALNATQLPPQENYCLEFLLCSFLVILEKESIIDDPMQYIPNLILKVRSTNVIHFLAVLVYSKMGDIGQIYFLSDDKELILLPLRWNGSIYDRVYREQYNVFRTYETMDIYVPKFSANMYRTWPKTDDQRATFIAGSYAYLANMIGRYFDTIVVLCSENVLRVYNDSEAISTLVDFAQKVDREYKPADVVIPFKFITLAE